MMIIIEALQGTAWLLLVVALFSLIFALREAQLVLREIYIRQLVERKAPMGKETLHKATS